jgi:hypothetical protein
MRENIETKKARLPYRPGVLPWTLGILGAALIDPAALSPLNEYRQNIAHAREQRVIKGRDFVRSILTQTNLKLNGSHSLTSNDYKLTGAVKLGNEIFKVGFSEKHGDVIEDGEKVFVVRDLGVAVDNVNARLEKAEGATK